MSAATWLSRIHDPAGGFFENLDAVGSPIANQRRATLVQARLTYVFSHAYLLSGDAAFRQAAAHGMAFLVRAARAPDGGWFRAASADGTTLDNTRDAYDHAFVLFALAWYFRATGDTSAIQLADATWQSMQARLADTEHGGFFEEFAPGRAQMKLPRRQNPHMHLLEALLALHVATGEKNWLRRAGALVDLFKRRFVDPETGALIEFFAGDWSPAPGDQGRLREPGHQFEWVWLLYEFYRHTRDESIQPYAERLFAFGTRFGIERRRRPCRRGVRRRRCGRRARCRHQAALAADRIHQGLRCARGISQRRRCARRDRRASRADRKVIHAARRRQLAQPARARRHAGSRPTPARVLYHLFLCVAEVDRLFSRPLSL